MTCVANASKQLACSYQWYNGSLTAVSSNKKLKPNDPGLYTCKAQCQIRNDSCKFTAMVISVSAVDAPGPGNNEIHSSFSMRAHNQATLMYLLNVSQKRWNVFRYFGNASFLGCCAVSKKF